MWMQIAVAIELMAIIGAVGIIVTKRTLVAFIAGFNTMALVTGVFLWHAGVTPRGALVLALVAVYLLRINWALIFWTGQTALSKLDEKTPLPQKLFLLLAATLLVFLRKGPFPLLGESLRVVVLEVVLP